MNTILVIALGISGLWNWYLSRKIATAEQEVAAMRPVVAAAVETYVYTTGQHRNISVLAKAAHDYEFGDEESEEVSQ